MSLNFFNQFLSPQILGLPLTILAMTLPTLLLFTKTPRLIQNRLSTMQTWMTTLFAKQLFLPMNKTGHNWAMMLLTVMLFLTSMNMTGLLPYTFTPTTQLSMNMGLAFPLWFATILIGLRNQPTTSLGHLLPEGTPTLLIPILILIETTSLFIRPLALGIRLTANLTAGHLLIQLISTAILVLLPISTTTSLLALLVLLLLTGLEIAVALIQAYVFTLLLSLYLQENV